jgi:hypothetical protein
VGLTVIVVLKGSPKQLFTVIGTTEYVIIWGTLEIFDKVWLIEFFAALKYLLPLHRVNGMNGHSLNKLFVNFVL